MTALLLVLCVISFTTWSVSAAALNEDFTWTRITYNWSGVGTSSRHGQSGSKHGNKNSNLDAIFFMDMSSEEDSNSASDNKTSVDFIENSNPPASIDYQYENNIPMGANVWKNKLFISVPRRRLGVPSTLNYIPLDSPLKHNVPLIPYPDWNTNLYPDTSGTNENLVSVYRVAIDPCDRMWLVDSGVLELPGNRTRVIPTTLVIIDLQTDKVIRRYVFPKRHLRPTTTLASVTVEVTKDTCDDAYTYLPDLGGYGLVVYSLKENRSWRVSHNYFFLEPLAGEFLISGHSFQWNDGVFSVELTDVKSDGFRDLFFHSMAGTHVYKVSTRVLRNETLATRSYHEDDFETVGDRGPNSQTSSADLHKPTSTMFLGLVNQNALGCWNVKKPLSTISVVQRDDKKMIYPSDVKISNDKIYLLTNGMPEFLYGKLNYDEVNFRVWSNSVSEAVKGTDCV